MSTATSFVVEELRSGLESLLQQTTCPLPVGDFVDQMIGLLAQHRVTDLHLRPQQTQWVMTCRYTGQVHSLVSLEQGFGQQVVSRLKVMASLLTYQSDQPQEGRLETSRCPQQVRLSTFPTIHGEAACLRFLQPRSHQTSLVDLGYPEPVTQSLCHQLHATDGAVLFTGPAGSGKTTSAYACLEWMNRQTAQHRAIHTLEDPIEFFCDDYSQTQVDGRTHLTLANAIKSVVRQDPDVILVGEIRDPAVAELTFQTALSGHLVLSTFHAGSCAAAIHRLFDYGIAPHLMLSALRSLLNQRLIHTQNEHATLIAESIPLAEDSLRVAIREQQPVSQLQQLAEKTGMISLHQQARQFLAEGRIAQKELVRVLGPDVMTTNPNWPDSITAQTDEGER